MLDMLIDETSAVNESAKALGAFYTDERVDSFLLRWAVRSPSDRVIDEIRMRSSEISICIPADWRSP